MRELGKRGGGSVTIRDVASKAGVSVASVSRAYNSLDNVREETKARIMAAAAELGYVPHAGARSLSIARTQAIGVILPDLHGEFFSECVRGMDREANRRGYLVLLSNMHDGRSRLDEVLRTMRGRVDGLLIMAPHVQIDALDQALTHGPPVVLINSGAVEGRLPSIEVDSAAAIDALIRHLAENGRRAVVHIAGPRDNREALEREENYIRSLRRHLPEARLRVYPGDFTEAGGEAAAREILASAEPCDAIFAANDSMAIGCLTALRQAGRAVPGDIAVAGFDNIPLARHLGLTTIHVPIAEIGGRAMNRLIDILDGEAQTAETGPVEVELVIRASTGAPG
jgi:LacI family transcriptional regulator